MRTRSMTAWAAVLTLSIATTAVAQQQNGQDARDAQRDRNQSTERQRNQRERNQRDQRDRDQGDRQRDDQRDRQRDQRDRQRGDIRAVPQGWVTIGADYDNDGRFEAIETIYVYDLRRAQEASRQRRGEQRREGDRGQARRRDDDRGRSTRRAYGERQRQRREQSVEGTIRNLDTIRLSGIDGDVLVARVDTGEDSAEDSAAKVLLGKKQNLRQLDLSEGDDVEITGVRGRVNDRTMLVAKEIRHDDRTVDVDHSALPAQKAKRVRGEIVSKRTASFRGRDEDFVIAEIETRGGNRRTVNLGAESKLEQLDNIGEGDNVSLIARFGRINGEPALIAQELRADGRSVDVSPPRRVGDRDRGRTRDRGRDARDRSRDSRDRERDNRDRERDNRDRNRNR